MRAFPSLDGADGHAAGLGKLGAGQVGGFTEAADFGRFHGRRVGGRCYKVNTQYA